MVDDFSIACLRASAADAGTRAPGVSGWSVGMHVHHCILSMTNICDLLLASDPAKARGRPTSIGSILLFLGRIPRGRAQTPRVAAPSPDVPADELLACLDQVEARLRSVQELPRAAWFRHFAFGVLDRDRALRFIRIHNDHHLRIVADIVKAGRPLRSPAA